MQGVSLIQLMDVLQFWNQQIILCYFEWIYFLK